MKKKLLISFALFLLFLSCNKNRQMPIEDGMKIKLSKHLLPEKENITQRLQTVTEWLKKNDFESYEMDDEDVRLGSLIYYDYLMHKNFKFVDYKVFNERVLQFFGIDLTQPEACPYLYNTSQYAAYLLPYTINESFESRVNNDISDYSRRKIFFCKDQKILIFRTPFFGRIFTCNEDNEWVADIPEFEYHFNNFILNESNSSLTWLIQNELELFCSYVKEFGYDKNEKLNKAVIQFYNEQNEDKELSYRGVVIHNLFAAHRCGKNFEVREGLLQAIVDMTTFTDNKYLKWLIYSIANPLAGSIRNPSSNEDKDEIFTEFLEEEKVKLLAYICYYVEKAYIKNGVDYANHDAEPTWVRRSLLSIQLKWTPELLEQLDKHNYYDLEDYKEMVKESLKIADELGWE